MGPVAQLSVKVSNISKLATERDIYDFFCFSGEITGIETKPSDDPAAPGTQVAYVTFQEERSVETALLLTDAVIADRAVKVEVAEDYVPPPKSALSPKTSWSPRDSASQGFGESSSQEPAGVKQAEGMVASLLASGYILSKDVLARARELDERHELSAKAKQQALTLQQSASVAASSLDQKYAISQKLAETSATLTRSFTSVDQKYNVSTRTKEALSAAEASLAEAGQYAMQNRYVAASRDWLWGAFGQLKTVVSEVQQQTLEKVSKAEEERTMGTSAAGTGGQRVGSQGLLEAYDEEELDGKPPLPAGSAPPSASSSAGVGSGTDARPIVVGLDDHGPPVAAAPIASGIPALDDAATAGASVRPAPGAGVASVSAALVAPPPAPAVSLMDAPMPASSQQRLAVPQQHEPPPLF